MSISRRRHRSIFGGEIAQAGGLFGGEGGEDCVVAGEDVVAEGGADGLRGGCRDVDVYFPEVIYKGEPGGGDLGGGGGGAESGAVGRDGAAVNRFDPGFCFRQGGGGSGSGSVLRGDDPVEGIQVRLQGVNAGLQRVQGHLEGVHNGRDGGRCWLGRAQQGPGQESCSNEAEGDPQRDYAPVQGRGECRDRGVAAGRVLAEAPAGDEPIAPREDLPHQAAEGVDVAAGVHGGAGYELGRGVAEGPAEGLLDAGIAVREAEVDELQGVVRTGYEDIFRRQVVVDYALTVEILHYGEQLRENAPAFLLRRIFGEPAA